MIQSNSMGMGGNMPSESGMGGGMGMEPSYGQEQELSKWALSKLSDIGLTEEQLRELASGFGPSSPYAEPANPEYLVQLILDGMYQVTFDPDTKTPVLVEGEGSPDPGEPVNEKPPVYEPDPEGPGEGGEDGEGGGGGGGGGGEDDDDDLPVPGPERPDGGTGGGGMPMDPITQMWWDMIKKGMSGDWVDDLNKMLAEQAKQQSEAMRADKDRAALERMVDSMMNPSEGSGGKDRIGPVGLFNLATGGGGRYQDAKGNQGKGPVVSSGTVQATPTVPMPQVNALGAPIETAAASTPGGSQQLKDILSATGSAASTAMGSQMKQQANQAQMAEKSAHAQRGMDIAGQVQQLGAQSDKLAQAQKQAKMAQALPLIQKTLNTSSLLGKR